MRFVLDAGVALAWFLSDESPEVIRYAGRVFDALDGGKDQPVVPAVWHGEVAAVLLRRVRGRALSEESFQRALHTFSTIPLETYADGLTVGAIVESARRYDIQAADALYFDLAIRLALPIATVDGGLKAAAQRFRVAVFEPAGPETSPP